MADTSAMKLAEYWVVNVKLPEMYPGSTFMERCLRLEYGGDFKVDGVSDCKSIVALVSTSRAKTRSNLPGAAHFHKLCLDAMYLDRLEPRPKRRLMVFTEKGMQLAMAAAAIRGRVPADIQYLHVELPAYIREKVEAARLVAQREVMIV